jgi:hypothetical protein
VADGLNIIPSYTGGDYGRTATQNAQPFKGIVIHVTGRPTLQSELDYMSKPDPNRPGYYGYHFLVDRDGKVYQTAPYDVRTNHILPSQGFSNNNALGVAFVGADKGTTPEQMASGKLLTDQLAGQFHIDPKNIVSHGELDPETRGAGKGLNPQGGSEGQDFIAAYRSGQAPQSSQTASMPARPATATPGLTLNTSPMDLVANLESGDRNIRQQIHDINTDKGTPAGGYFQIIDPTWQRYAAAAGVDVKQFPTAMSAPRAVQAQVASAIPVNQWGQNTQNALKAQYPWLDTSQTLGAVQSKALGGSGATAVASATPPAGALASAGGGSILPGFSDAKTSDKFKKDVGDFSKAMGYDQGDQAPRIQPMGPPPVARNTSALGGAMLPMSSQLQAQITGYQPQAYGQTLTSIADPMQWGSASPGSMPGAQTGPQQAPGGASPYGTSLAGLQMAYGLSPQQLQMLMSPMMLNQGGSYG